MVSVAFVVSATGGAEVEDFAVKRSLISTAGTASSVALVALAVSDTAGLEPVAGCPVWLVFSTASGPVG